MNETEEKELDAATAGLQQLLDEQSTSAAMLQQAATQGAVNVAAIVKLRQRADSLPTHIFGAQVRAARARIALLESQCQKNDAALTVVAEAAEEKWQQLKVAEAEWQTARNSRDATKSASDLARADLSTARRELEALLLAHSRPPAPIVRSHPHRVAG